MTIASITQDVLEGMEHFEEDIIEIEKAISLAIAKRDEEWKDAIRELNLKYPSQCFGSTGLAWNLELFARMAEEKNG